MNILIILGHPALKRHSFCEALAEAYREGAAKSGHDVQLYKVADKSFDPILHEGYVEEQAAEPDIVEAREKILWADHLVFVYPLWDYMVPTLLKGFLERAFIRGFAYEVALDSGKKKKLLAGKSAQLIQTSGMPSFIYRFWYRAHGAKALRDLLSFCGIKPIRTHCFGMIEGCDKRRRQYLEKVKMLGAERNCRNALP